MKIDLVYLWVDGSDKKWIAKKNIALTKAGLKKIDASNARYFDNDELKYSLRSVQKFAPWINNIFIVTDGQTPKWLNIKNPKITIVDHKDIMPKSILPVFNAAVIEFYITNIKNLSEHFLFANDDTFFGNSILPSYFFNIDGLPIIRGKLDYSFSKIKNTAEPYTNMVLRSKRLISSIYGEKHNYNWMPAHNIDPYRKSFMIDVINNKNIKKEIAARSTHTFRQADDLQRTLFHEYFLANKLAVIKIYGRLKRIFMKLFGAYTDFPQYVTNAKKLEKMHAMPKLFCINNSGTNPDRDIYNHKFLEKMFPDKSEFEN